MTPHCSPVYSCDIHASWLREAEREYIIRRRHLLGMRKWAKRYDREVAAASALVAKRDLYLLRPIKGGEKL